MIDVLMLGEKRLNPLDIRISVVILPTNTAIHFLVPVIKKKKIWCYCYIELTPFSSIISFPFLNISLQDNVFNLHGEVICLLYLGVK